MKNGKYLILVLCAIVASAAADDCTERTEGKVGVTNAGVRFICEKAPKCQYTYESTKCVPRKDPESGVVYEVVVGPCYNEDGVGIYTPVPDYTNVSDADCVGRAPE